MRKICVFVGSRANYSSIKSALKAIQADERLELQLVVGASAVLSRYGAVVDLIERDGFEISDRVNMIIEGETPQTMAQSTGLGLIEISGILQRLKPDIVLTVGDRFETMATTLAAAYMNIPIAHTMGGEVTGTIDESIRHAVTKFAHIHFPASEDARQRIIRLGEDPANVFMVGCPRIDLVRDLLEGQTKVDDSMLRLGVGKEIDISQPFVLVSQHPVTSEYGESEDQIRKTLEAVKKLQMQAIVLWPNADAGSEDIAKGIRKLREEGRASRMHFYKNLPTDLYIYLMSKTACLIGNSSSGVREGIYIGTPVVNVGSRQNKRQRGHNTIDCCYDTDEIFDAASRQIAHGKYESDNTYGCGDSGKKIAEVLAAIQVNTQKTICY